MVTYTYSILVGILQWVGLYAYILFARCVRNLWMKQKQKGKLFVGLWQRGGDDNAPCSLRENMNNWGGPKSE